MKTGPTIAKGKSKQDYATPPDFRAAIVRKFGQPLWDLAASAENTFAQNYYTKENDSLRMHWNLLDGLLWLNPPFADITPWAKKCYEESEKGAQILLLVPASVGSNWFRDYVFRKSRIWYLNGRISFDGLHGFPKDCMVCKYDGLATPKEQIWRWKP